MPAATQTSPFTRTRRPISWRAGRGMALRYRGRCHCDGHLGRESRVRKGILIAKPTVMFRRVGTLSYSQDAPPKSRELFGRRKRTSNKVRVSSYRIKLCQGNPTGWRGRVWPDDFIFWMRQRWFCRHRMPQMPFHAYLCVDVAVVPIWVLSACIAALRRDKLISWCLGLHFTLILCNGAQLAIGFVEDEALSCGD